MFNHSGSEQGNLESRHFINALISYVMLPETFFFANFRGQFLVAYS